MRRRIQVSEPPLLEGVVESQGARGCDPGPLEKVRSAGLDTICNGLVYYGYTHIFRGRLAVRGYGNDGTAVVRRFAYSSPGACHTVH